LTFDVADASKLSLSLYGKRPGPGMRLDKLRLQFAMRDTGLIGDVLEAYERLILDAMRGDHTLFTTAEGIERLWEVSIPLLDSPPPVRTSLENALSRHAAEGLAPRLFVLAEAVGDERRDRLHDFYRLGTRRSHGDGHSRPGAKGQNAHDRGPADGFPAAADRDDGIEPIDTLHEFRGRARVEPLAIDDFKGAHENIPRRFEIRAIARLDRVRIVRDHLAPKNLLAT
jgi:Glucose-6-phosphate dehydrogenase, C-terminal domain